MDPGDGPRDPKVVSKTKSDVEEQINELVLALRSKAVVRTDHNNKCSNQSPAAASGSVQGKACSKPLITVHGSTIHYRPQGSMDPGPAIHQDRPEIAPKTNVQESPVVDAPKVVVPLQEEEPDQGSTSSQKGHPSPLVAHPNMLRCINMNCSTLPPFIDIPPLQGTLPPFSFFKSKIAMGKVEAGDPFMMIEREHRWTVNEADHCAFLHRLDHVTGQPVMTFQIEKVQDRSHVLAKQHFYEHHVRYLEAHLMQRASAIPV